MVLSTALSNVNCVHKSFSRINFIWKIIGIIGTHGMETVRLGNKFEADNFVMGTFG